MRFLAITSVIVILLLSGCTDNTPKETTTTTTQPTIPQPTTTSTAVIVTSTSTILPIHEDIEISPELLANFNNNRAYKADVIVFMKDNSGLEFLTSQENSEIYETYVVKTRINEPVQKHTLDVLGEKGFVPKKKSNDGSWFGGQITYEQFYLLRRNENVKSILAEEGGYQRVWELPYAVNKSYIRECAETSECTLAKNDCCGNEALSLNRKYLEFYEDSLMRECYFRSCAANAKVWNFEAVCNNGVCDVRKKD